MIRTRARPGLLLPGLILFLLPVRMPAATPPSTPPAAPGAAVQSIDLDAFGRAHRRVALPNGMQLAYVSWGDPHGSPVLLIHGYTDNARDWVPLLPWLDPHHHYIVVDIRGHGQSARPECCYTRLDFAYDLKLLLDSLEVQRVDVVGHSLGGIIAQTFAEYWPERTRRVVLISSTAGPDRNAPPRAPRFDFAAGIRQMHEPIDPDSPFMVEWWSSPSPVDAEFLRRQRVDSAHIPLRVWLAVLDQALGDTGELQRTLPRLVAPTLLIWGERDPIFAEDARATLRAGLPHAEVRVLPGLGHNPFWEDPRGCAVLIEEFLAARDPGR